MPKEISDGLTKEEDQELCRIFDKWAEQGGGAFADATYERLANALPQPTVETVILRKNKENIEVLLTPRPANDSIWGGMLHSPGGAIRRKDYLREDKNPINGVFERVQNQELNCKFATEPVFVSMAHYMTKRGPEVVHIYCCTIPEDSQIQDSQWAPVTELESTPKFVQHQIVPIMKAVEKFTSNN